MANLYIFIDESGNFDFSPKGTRYLVLCAYSTDLPLQHSLNLQSLKYNYLERGREIEYFHASEDIQDVRDKVIKIISESNRAIFDYVFLPKNRAHPLLQSKTKIYPLMAGALTSYIFGRLNKSQIAYDMIIIIFDRLFIKSEQARIESVIKPRLKQTGRPFQIYFFQTKSDPNAQIADYGAWAKYVSLQRREYRPIKQIKHLVSNDFNVFRKGSKKFY